jgi:hypothetical protein
VGAEVTDDAANDKTIITVSAAANPSEGDLLDVLLAGPDLDALWKLNEASGTTAQDSTANNWDLDVPAGYSAPTWAQAAGPTEDQSAEFVDGADDALSRTASPAFPSYSSDFTASIWVNLEEAGADVHYLMGQGNPIASNGWMLAVGGATGGSFGRRIYLSINGGGITEIGGDNDLTTDGTTWYYLAVTRASGTFRLYVNGLLQSNTTAAAMTAQPGMRIGDLQDNAGAESVYNLKGLASYAAVWSRALSGVELREHWNLGSRATGGLFDSGLVWTSDGVGGAVWDEGTIEVAEGGVLTGRRPRINLIEGTNITITTADDAVDDEIDVTIAATTAGGVVWTEVVKGSDESVASSTVVQNDDELFFSATSGAVYDLELFLIYESPAGGGTPDIKLDFGEDGTARGMIAQAGTYSTANAVNNVTAILINQSSVFSFGTDTNPRVLRATGWYVGGGGTFRVRWAQNTSGINATVVKAGSTLRYRRMN